ncbi:hypothetical protein PybrP1_009102 [[Pythium] brassicae (nom. inval.)]|nr:hypothetical protein PybrP1_009102 [[Pythium] brassicae (nom. inval.)]
MGASFSMGSGAGLRLEPIKPAGNSGGYHHPQQQHHPQHSQYASLEFGGTRPRASSQAQIRSLLDRTNAALDKIVRIRESMEPFVDFKQFEKPPRGSSAGSRASHERGTTRMSRLSSGPTLLDQPRTTSTSSYGSTEASLSSEDPLGRSTNSTHSSSSSSLGEDDAAEHASSSAQRQPSPASASVSSARAATETHDVADMDADADADDDDEEEEERESGNDTFDDSDSSLSGISGTELSPLKEARLERLKTIEIAFHEGLPKEFFQVLARFLFSTIEVKTRHSRFNFYKDTFTGSDAIKQMVLNGFAEDQPTALRLGSVLVRLGYIEHVSRTDDQLHSSKDNFYRFTKALEYDDGDYLAGSPGGSHARASITAANYRESVLSRESAGVVEYDFAAASDDVHALVTDEVLQIFARVLLKVFERKNKLLFYKGFVGCFLGAEAVNVIRELRIAGSLLDAVLVGQALVDEGVVEPIATTVPTFQDKYVFYRLTKMRA